MKFSIIKHVFYKLEEKYFLNKLILFLVITLFFIPDNIWLQEKNIIQEATVKIHGKKLFSYYSRLGPLSSLDRAKITKTKIEEIITKSQWHPEKIKIEKSEIGIDIFYEEQVIITLTSSDLDYWNQLHQTNYTIEEYANIIINTINTELKETHWNFFIKNIILGSFYSLLIFIVLLIVLKYTKKLFLKLELKLESYKGIFIRPIRIQRLELVNEDQLLLTIKYILRGIRYLLSIFFIYFYLSIVFIFFPKTKDISITLLDYVWNPIKNIISGILSYLPNLFLIIIVIVITYYLIKFINLIFKELENGTIRIPNFYPEYIKPTNYIIKILVFSFALIIIFPYLPGYDSPAFQNISVFIGILFSLGSMGIISNLISGFILTYMRAFNIGDYVEIGNNYGKIIEKGILTTRILTNKNVLITISNSQILNSHIINYSKQEFTILHTKVTIGYDVPWRKVHELLIESALRVESIKKEPKPFVLQTSLDDFYVSYELNAYTDRFDIMPKIYSEIHQNIQDLFNENGIEILSPHYRAIRDGNLIAIPESYIPKNYSIPYFKVKLEK